MYSEVFSDVITVHISLEIVAVISSMWKEFFTLPNILSTGQSNKIGPMLYSNVAANDLITWTNVNISPYIISHSIASPWLQGAYTRAIALGRHFKILIHRIKSYIENPPGST